MGAENEVFSGKALAAEDLPCDQSAQAFHQETEPELLNCQEKVFRNLVPVQLELR